MTDFNLSDKITPSWREDEKGNKIYENNYFKEEDVKEFIRLLKKDLGNDCTFWNNIRLINKLAGSKLTEETEIIHNGKKYRLVEE
jgi:hypothetical protein